MQLKFSGWHDTPNRNETELEEVFQLAIRDAIDPAHNPENYLEENDYNFAYEYGLGQVEFVLSAYLEPEKRRLRYVEWATALTGLNNCRLAYPGLSWYFVISMFIKKEQEEPVEYSWGCTGVQGGACYV